MSNPEIFRGADLDSLRSLPRLTSKDREVLERLVTLAPDAAIATASAILRTHQGDLHDLFFPPGSAQRRPDLGQLSAALVYLGLAMAAPGQGKFLPILSSRDFQESRALAAATMAQIPAGAWEDSDERLRLLPDAELARLLDAFVARLTTRPDRDPRVVRSIIFGHATAFYAVLARVCAEQFRPSGDVPAAVAHIERLARTRDIVVGVLAKDEAARPYDPARRDAQIAQLREFGWQEFVASSGRTLRQIAAEASEHGFTSYSEFALTDEWRERGADAPTTGHRYFVRPALLPDSTGLTLATQLDRLKPLQKILAGDPAETGLRLGLGSAELLLEYVVNSGAMDFLDGRWTRTSNQFGGQHTRFGIVGPRTYAITLFPGSRFDDAVGLWPVIEELPEPT